ncbi:hypothetical protein ACFC4G_40350 [Streptomyces sp. NPDC056002]|uniref:hypothetical protein n=1 Tax=Streptomyces sp. NPDC056002 TaxID=3345675 RepID=UPI0035D5C81C
MRTRRGLATSSKRASNDRKEIARQAGWGDNSAATEGYFEDGEGWQENRVVDVLGSLHRVGGQPGARGLGLQPESIGDVITRAGERAGIEIRFTGHSPRRGLATSSRLKGHDQIIIAKQGGRAPHSKVLAGHLEVSGRTTP